MLLLDTFFDSAVVVDDNKEEGEALVKMLRGHGIHTDFILYSAGKKIKLFKRNRKLVFMDLMLNGDSNQEAVNMSMLITALGKICGDSNFGLYGLVVWTKHANLKARLLRRIALASFDKDPSTDATNEEELEMSNSKINPPLFVLCLDKSKYINDYSTLGEDLEKELKADAAAYFYSRWCWSVELAKIKAVRDIYKLVGDYENHSGKFTYILRQLASQHSGTKDPYEYLTVDAYKAFDELLYADLTCLQREEIFPNLKEGLRNPFEVGETKMIEAALNTKLFIDADAISQGVVVPGNVYLIQGERSELKIDLNEKCFESIDKDSVQYVAIELTPPCDFSNKKIGSRVVGGIICDMITDKGKMRNLQKSCGDKRYIVRGVLIGRETPKFVMFDFRYLYTPKTEELMDGDKYKILFRAKPRLFADILQKFSSHAARLGLAEFSFEA